MAKALLRARGRTSLAIATLLAVLSAGCDGSGSPTAPRSPAGPQATVTITYLAATAADPAVAQFTACIDAVGPTHIHPGWRGFVRVILPAFPPDRFEITFSDVPVGNRQSLRISDRNACDTDPNGASTENVFANGTRLTDVVDTPGNGAEPGLAFTVAADGTVTP